MFRILDCVDALNEKMGLNLTHHDINWIYNLHHLTGQGYYLKSRYLKVRLIQCLSDSNKDLKKGLFNPVRRVGRWPPLFDEGGETRWGSQFRFHNFKIIPFSCSLTFAHIENFL